MWLLLPTGGLKSNWLVRKTSFIKEPATFSHETCEQCFINPEFFSSASCIQHTGKTASPSRVFTWTSVIFFFFFVGGLCPSWYTYALGAGFRSVSVINFPIFVCIPLLIDLRWNSSSSVSNSWLNTFPALKKTINRCLIKWNMQALPLSRDADGPQRKNTNYRWQQTQT